MGIDHIEMAQGNASRDHDRHQYVTAEIEEREKTGIIYRDHGDPVNMLFRDARK